MDRDDVLAARLATQRLSGPPAPTPTWVVRELLCVQAQDPPLARAMIAVRCDATDADVQAAVASGEIVRTHVLRPTWHYVAATDLRWLLQLTSAKVESGMAARHRQLGLDETRVASALAVLVDRLAGRRYANRSELGQALAEAGVLSGEEPLFGQQVGHVLLLAELRGLICSAPVAGPEHRYALADDVLPAAPAFDRSAAVAGLVERFVAGHGPVALSDLIRWARVSLTEVRAALGDLGDRLDSVTIGADELWFSPAHRREETRPAPAWLLSTFDEAFLSYRTVPWPRSAGHPAGNDPYRFAEAGGGVVLHGLRDVGSWKRTRARNGTRIELNLDSSLTAEARREVDAAAERLVQTIG